MHEGEAWQEFKFNGLPKSGIGYERERFANSDLFCGSSHVWIWRKDQFGKKQMLLQKRSVKKDVCPGLWDSSAAGHINLEESPVDAAVREAKEEINLDINPDKLWFSFSFRDAINEDTKFNEIQSIYLYEQCEEFECKFNDNEVDEINWTTLSDLKSMIKSGRVVDHGSEYFDNLFYHLNAV